MRKFLVIISSLLVLAPFELSILSFGESTQDPVSKKLIDTIVHYQEPSGLTPFSLEDNVETGSDYTWGLWMMSLVAAERTGYLDRAPTVERLSKMLQTIDQLKKYKGWLYWGYHLKTLEPDLDRIGFQGWYLYSLIVVKNVYPELSSLCEKLLSAVDYSIVYDAQEKFLADFNVTEQKKAWRIPLGPLSDGSDPGYPASERRVAYQVYTYLTGDKSPWLLQGEPNFQEVEGLKFLSVWAHYNFDIGHLHYVLPETGYYEKSWENFLEASRIFMKKQELKFFPVRSGTLEEGLWNPASPNTEHRETMPWITWYLEPDAPVMEYCFKEKHGLFRYYDQWNFYWSYGKNLQVAASLGSREGNSNAADSSVSLRFFVNTTPRFNRPPQLKKLSLVASIPDPDHLPKGSLEIYLNRSKIGEIRPSELSDQPAQITRPFSINLKSVNTLTFKNSDLEVQDANRFDLYRYENNVSSCEYAYQVPELSLTESLHGYEFSAFAEEVSDAQYPGPAVEVVCEGQDIGPTVEDTCTALLIRLGVMHGYYVWQDLLSDPKFTGSLVAWVGNYSARARLATTIHNVSGVPVKVEYERPREWSDVQKIHVVDEKDARDISNQLQISDEMISWQAEGHHTYQIGYARGDEK